MINVPKLEETNEAIRNYKVKSSQLNTYLLISALLIPLIIGIFLVIIVLLKREKILRPYRKMIDIARRNDQVKHEELLRIKTREQYYKEHPRLPPQLAKQVIKNEKTQQEAKIIENGV